MSGDFTGEDTVLAASGNDALIGQTIGNYRVTDILGKGGFGAVYKAEDIKLGRTVALKFLRQANEEFHAELFEREARALGALGKHSNIVQIHAWDEFKGANFFVLEYMSNSVSDEMLKYPEGMPIDMAIRIIAQCADGLAFAHDAEILHRDIKAQNILLEASDGTAKIADFGLARICGPSANTIEGRAIGSPVYMAPEQARGQQLTHLCDIYSLGVTLYELLSGKPSVSGSSILEVLEKVRNNDRVPLRAQKPGLPDALYAIVDRAMAPEPANRYQTAAAMAEDLRKIEAVNMAPVPTPPVTTVNETPMIQTLTPLTTSATDSVIESKPTPNPKPAPKPVDEKKPASSGAGIAKWVAAAIVILIAIGAGYGLSSMKSDAPAKKPDTGVAAQPPAETEPVEAPASEPIMAEETPTIDPEMVILTLPLGLDAISGVTPPETTEAAVATETAPEPPSSEQTKEQVPDEPIKKAESPVAQEKEPVKKTVSEPAKATAAGKSSTGSSTSPPKKENVVPATTTQAPPVKVEAPTKEEVMVEEPEPVPVSNPVPAQPVEAQPAKDTPSEEPSMTEEEIVRRIGKSTVTITREVPIQDTGSSDGSSETPAEAQPAADTTQDSSTSGETVVRRIGKSTVVVRRDTSTSDTGGSTESTEPAENQPATNSTEDSSDSSSSLERRRGKGSVIIDN